jgi:hypothetical protein
MLTTPSNLTQLCLLTTTAPCLLLSSSKVILFGYRVTLLEKRLSILSSSHCRPSRTAARYSGSPKTLHKPNKRTVAPYFTSFPKVLFPVLMHSFCSNEQFDTISPKPLRKPNKRTVSPYFTSFSKVLFSNIVAPLLGRVIRYYIYQAALKSTKRTVAPYFTSSFKVLLSGIDAHSYSKG